MQATLGEALGSLAQSKKQAIEQSDEPNGKPWTPTLVLRSKEFAIPKESFKQRHTANRATILGWWINQARHTLELRNRTIDIAIRIFDYYCYKKYEESKNKGEKNKQGEYLHILDSRYQSKLTATTCFFTTSKYEEIYPPVLNDFLYYQSEKGKDKIDRQAVLKREVDLIYTTNVNFTISLITDWFDLFSPAPKQRMPGWGLFCYLHAPFVSSEELAEAIFAVVETTTCSDTQRCINAVLKELKIEIPYFLKDKNNRITSRLAPNRELA